MWCSTIQVGDCAAVGCRTDSAIEQVGTQAVRQSEEMTAEEKKRAKEAAVTAGVGLRSGDSAADKVADQFAPRRWTTFTSRRRKNCSALCCRSTLPYRFPRAAGIGAAEHAARMTAMDSATNNASDMIDSLTLV